MSKAVHFWSGRLEKGEITTKIRVDLPDDTKMELWALDRLDLNQADRQLLDASMDVAIDDEQAVRADAVLERFRRRAREKPEKREWGRRNDPAEAVIATWRDGLGHRA
jgi:hypothetical protein